MFICVIFDYLKHLSVTNIKKYFFYTTVYIEKLIDRCWNLSPKTDEDKDFHALNPVWSVYIQDSECNVFGLFVYCLFPPEKKPNYLKALSNIVNKLPKQVQVTELPAVSNTEQLWCS